MKFSIDAAVGGALMSKPINEAKQLFEDMASNNYHWENERGQPKKGERYEIDSFTMLARWMPFSRRWIAFNLLPLLVVLKVEYMLKGIFVKCVIFKSTL